MNSGYLACKNEGGEVISQVIWRTGLQGEEEEDIKWRR